MSDPDILKRYPRSFTPLAVAIRRPARENPVIRERLFGQDSRLPMLFQYNPLMHHVEVNEHQELLFTITRGALLSPRVRYNVHDQGGVARFDQMTQLLTSLGVDVRKLQGDHPDGTLPLPFIWVYGRRDYTVSVMGANIYPEDLEQCLYAEPELARITTSFCLSLHETEAAQVRPCFLFELDGEPSEGLQEAFATAMLRRLIELNADFREAWKEYPDALVPRVELYRRGEGPFANDSGKIKQGRVLR